MVKPERRYRRVVTGHNAQGRSMVLIDDPSPHAYVLEKAGGLQLTELWETTSSPADNSGTQDAGDHERRIQPKGGGSVFRIIEYPPDSVRLKTIKPEEFFSSMGAQAAHASRKLHAGTHTTDTVDYVIVLSGEIYAVLDEGEVLLHAGDCLVQRGTRHAWSNRTQVPCAIAFVLVAAAPLAAPVR